ncbi:MAG: MucR family transcriptional regulator, partial [Pseudomonadota bacterium]
METDDTHDTQTKEQDTLKLTAQIVSSFVANNSVAVETLPSLIETIQATLDGLVAGGVTADDDILLPAIPISESVTDDYLICLEDGKKFKSLKRHLRSKYNLTAAEYREKWGLPHDYP